MRPPFRSSSSPYTAAPPTRKTATIGVDGDLDELPCAYMQPVVGEEIENANEGKYQHPNNQDRILRIIVSAI